MAGISIGKTDLKLGERKCLEVKGKKLALANIKGKYYCIDSTCPHAGGPLCEGKIGEKSESSVTCPWHGSVFDLKNGKVLNGPAIDGVKSYPVKVKSGELFIEI
jgi:nitrite reductase/ring-hydroxylating ferredoxin subunit